MDNHYSYEPMLSPAANAMINQREEERNQQNDHSRSEMMHQDNIMRRMTDYDDEDDLKDQTNNSVVEKIRSRRVDYKEKDNIFYTARFLFECGYKLRCSPETIAAAAALFHRFFKECDSTSYDKYLIASTTLYIVGKAYDEKYKIRDVINVSYNTLNRSSSPLDLSDDYWLRRDAIVQAELLIMRMLCFNVTYDNPHKYLLHYFSTLKTWLPHSVWETVPLIQASYGFLQDYHHDASVISHKPQYIAIACIHLAFLCYGVDLPNYSETENRTWYHAFCPELDDEKLSVIIDSIIDVYGTEPSGSLME